MENSRAADLARVAAGVVLCAVSGELFVRAISLRRDVRWIMLP